MKQTMTSRDLIDLRKQDERSRGRGIRSIAWLDELVSMSVHAGSEEEHTYEEHEHGGGRDSHHCALISIGGGTDSTERNRTNYQPAESRYEPIRAKIPRRVSCDQQRAGYSQKNCDERHTRDII
jgi:hypothetical protein